MSATATTAGMPAYFYNTSDGGRTRLRADQAKEQKIARSLSSREVLFNQGLQRATGKITATLPSGLEGIRTPRTGEYECRHPDRGVSTKGVVKKITERELGGFGHKPTETT